MPSITLKGRKIEYTLRESKRAKRINIRVDGRNGVQLVYPVGVTFPPPTELLRQHEAWLLEVVDKLETRTGNQFERSYKEGEIFSYLGESYHLRILHKANGNYITVKLNQEKTLDVSLPPNLSSQQEQENIVGAIEWFYRKQAKIYIPERTAEIANPLGFQYERVTIKNQKTRWGSCSSNKNLNFNLRLMMAPQAAIDYIIIHELCHLVHLNHSKQFWNLVSKYCPDYKHWRKWFKDNSRFLIL